MKTCVRNIREVRRAPKDDTENVYIGRGSKWGNPFRIGEHGTRANVIQLQKTHILNQPELLEAIRIGELHGKYLWCYCAPRSCHGDTYVVLDDLLYGKDSIDAVIRHLRKLWA